MAIKQKSFEMIEESLVTNKQLFCFPKAIKCELHSPTIITIFITISTIISEFKLIF